MLRDQVSSTHSEKVKNFKVQIGPNDPYHHLSHIDHDWKKWIFSRARALRARTDYVAPLRKADLRSAYVASLRKRWCEATIRGIMPEHL